MQYPRESKIEKLTKDFVLANTGEHVELRLKDNIIIQPVTKKGSTVLGIFWANVLQHKNNFPKFLYEYKKYFDEKKGEEKLYVTISNITFIVYLKTGTFCICSEDDVYFWFSSHFRDLMLQYDSDFVSTWEYNPTSYRTEKTTVLSENYHDTYTPTEEYLLMRNIKHQRDIVFEERLAESVDGLISGMGDLDIDMVLWKDDALDTQLDCLKSGGLYDSFHFLYRLYMSVLFKWFSRENTKIYISSPTVDAKILKTVLRLFLGASHAPRATVQAFYTEFKCDPANGLSSMEVKKQALSSYDDRLRAYLEYHVLRKITHLTKSLTGSFLAAVHDGKAEVLVAGAHLHSSHLHEHRLESATYVIMDEDMFMRKYITPCEGCNATVTY